MSPLLITLAAAFVGTTALCMWLGSLAFATQSADHRSRRVSLWRTLGARPEGVDLLRHDGPSDGASLVTVIFHALGFKPTSILRWVSQAEVRMSLNTVLAIALAVATVTGLTAWCLGVPVSFWPVLVIVGFFAPLAPIYYRANRRLKLFADQFPDALELMASALRSGNTIQSSIQIIVEEMMPPVSKEFATASEAVKLGVPIEQALQDLADRIPNPDVQFFTTAVCMQRQCGGDLSEILDKICWLVRERAYLQGQVMALTGEGRMSGWVLMGLPVVLLVVVYALNPTYVQLLWTEPLGQKMLAGAVTLQVLGAAAIHKIVNFKM
jgi:tight adherence protein B